MAARKKTTKGSGKTRAQAKRATKGNALPAKAAPKATKTASNMPSSIAILSRLSAAFRIETESWGVK